MAQSNHAAQAQKLREDAVKKMQSSSFFFGSKTGKYEDAAELYKKASNLLKVAQQDNEAAQSYLDAANCYQQTPNNGHEEASCYVKAASCYKKEAYKEAVTALQKAIDIYSSDGRFGMAAKYEKEVAELYENNNENASAIPHYEIAARYFDSENSSSTANGCRLKVAQFCAESQDYKKAIEIFESVAKASISNKLLQYSVKEYLFKAMLCQLCVGDLVETKKAHQRYMGLDPSFGQSREGKLVGVITDAVENRDEESFDSAVEEFTHITPFDAWKSNLMEIIHEKIKKEDEEDSDGVL